MDCMHDCSLDVFFLEWSLCKYLLQIQFAPKQVGVENSET